MILCCQMCGESIELPTEPAEGQNVKCPFCDGKFAYRKPRVERPRANFPCPLCGWELEIESEPAEGQHIRCPYCDGKFSYAKHVPSNVELHETTAARFTSRAALRLAKKHWKKLRIMLPLLVLGTAVLGTCVLCLLVLSSFNGDSSAKVAPAPDISVNDLEDVNTNEINESPIEISGGVTGNGTPQLIAPVNDDTEQANSFIFREENGCAVIVGYVGTKIDVEIPESINSLPVVSIGKGAFKNKTSIESVFLSAGITNVGHYAFYGCGNMMRIDLPEGLKTIGDYAFCYCTNLEYITIPRSVTSIGYRAFKFLNLKAVNTPSLEAWCHIGFRSQTANPLCVSFDHKLTVGGNVISHLEIPDGITSTRANAFVNISVESVTIPASVTYLGSRTFAFDKGLSRINDIFFRGNAPTLGKNVFGGVSSNCTVHVSPSSTGWGVVIPGSWNGMHIEYERRGDGASQSITPVNVPQVTPSVTTNIPSVIGTFVVESGTLTETVNGVAWRYTVSNGEATIGGKDSSAIPQSTTGGVTIPEKLGGNLVVEIGDNAFAGCNKIETVMVPAKVRRIGNLAFDGCVSLRDVRFLSGRESRVMISPGLTEIGDEAFKGCISLHSIKLPERIRKIGDRAFWTSRGWKTVSLSPGIGKISLGVSVVDDTSKEKFCSDGFFAWVEPHTAKYVPNPFHSERSITVVPVLKAVPRGLKFVRIHGGNGIESVSRGTSGVLYVPSAVNGVPVVCINNLAFYGCTKLTKVVVPSTVMEVGEKAFLNCTALRSVVCLNKDTCIAPTALDGCPNAKITYVGEPTTVFPPEQPPSLDSSGVVSNAPKPGSTYMVIDLSGGASVKQFPVSWLDTMPANGWADEYKTTKLVLRRIPSGMFMMGSPIKEVGHNRSETQHNVTLTRPYYIGVFEMTQRQWQLVTGEADSNSRRVDAMPMQDVSWERIRGNRFDCDWPQSRRVDGNSFVGKLRAKTGIGSFDLPTEAQWEYACRAGAITALNSWKELTDKYRSRDLAELGRYRFILDNDQFSGLSEVKNPCSVVVGSYKANIWGLYDMHGNVREWCLDRWGDHGKDAVNDPCGPSGNNPDGSRVLKGGDYSAYAEYCRSASRTSCHPQWGNGSNGFRICCDATGFGVGGGVVPITSSGVQLTGVTLSVGHPRKISNNIPSGNQRTICERYEYDGKISCRVKPKNAFATMTIEVYYITKEGAEKIEAAEVVGNFTFGGNNPKTQKFHFMSPAVTQTVERFNYTDYWSDASTSQTRRTGKQYLGCIVRALVDGKVEKVYTVPSNERWKKAGREPFVSLQ